MKPGAKSVLSGRRFLEYKTDDAREHRTCSQTTTNTDNLSGSSAEEEEDESDDDMDSVQGIWGSREATMRPDSPTRPGAVAVRGSGHHLCDDNDATSTVGSQDTPVDTPLPLLRAELVNDQQEELRRKLEMQAMELMHLRRTVGALNSVAVADAIPDILFVEGSTGCASSRRRYDAEMHARLVLLGEDTERDSDSHYGAFSYPPQNSCCVIL